MLARRCKHARISPNIWRFPLVFEKVLKWRVGGAFTPRLYYECLENVSKLIENVHFAKKLPAAGYYFIFDPRSYISVLLYILY